MVTPLTRRELVGSAVGYLAVAFVLFGPMLRPGALLHLDLVITDRIDLSHGFWGLGPELPRLTPFEVPLVAAGALFGGEVVKLVLLVAPVLAALGLQRLVRRLGVSTWPAVGAGLLYGFGPWLTTRITVGHLTMVGTAALLPWVLPALLDPRRDQRRSLLAAAAMAVFGFYGGLVAGLVVACGYLGRWQLPTVRSVAGFVATQLPWLLPGALVLTAAGALGGSALFPSGIDDVVDVPALLAGSGFWQDRLQVGGDAGLLEATLGLLLGGLALWGARQTGRLRHWWLWLLVVVPTALTLMDAVPGARGVYADITSVGPAAALREPQRLMVLPLLVVAAGMAVGVERIAETVREPGWRWALVLTPLAVGSVLAAPAVPVVRDRLTPVQLAPEWREAAEAVDADPGSVLVLPWERYLNIGAVDGRRVLNPALSWFGPSSIVASDLGLDGASTERADPREAAIEELLPSLRSRPSDAGGLDGLGVDWVVLLHEIDYEQYLVLLDDPALRLVVSAGSLDLFRVVGADGPSEPVAIDQILPPLGRIAEGPATPVVWDRPYQWGWLRGFEPGRETPDGRLLFEGSSRWVWYWPAAVVVAVDLAWLVWIAGVAVVTLRGQRSPPVVKLARNNQAS